MELETQSIGQVNVVTVRGDVMVTDVPSLEAVLQRYTTVGRYHCLIDLRECTYLGSSGMSLLISFANSCRRWRLGDVLLIGPQPSVRSLLELAGLISEERSFFRLIDNVEDGLAYFEAFSAQ
ncbi:STAS domain-containing protein [bacterium]|nr:STAS domain-containing protein [bacterium]